MTSDDLPSPPQEFAFWRVGTTEIEESDLILKVLDASSVNIDLHLETIKEVLGTLNISDKLEIIIFNKIDLLDTNDLNRLKAKYPNSLFISAIRELKINELLDGIQKEISKLNKTIEIDIPYNELSIIDYIYKTCKIIFREDKYDKVSFKIESSPQNINKIQSAIK